MGIGQNTLWIIVSISSSGVPKGRQAILDPNDARLSLKFTSEAAAWRYMDKLPATKGDTYFPIEVRG